MKTIKIRNFHRIPILLKILMLLGLPLIICFLVVGITEDIGGLTFIGAFVLVIVAVGFGFFYSYGIKITSKRVTVLNQDMIKTFRYDDVVYIEIIFDEDTICGEIKAKQQPKCFFYFDGIDLNRGAVFSTRFLESNLKITKKFVDKSIAQLSNCEKVRVKNLYIDCKKNKK